MISVIECIPCLARQAAEAVALAVREPERRESVLRLLLRELYGMDWHVTPPVMAARMHRMIRDLSIAKGQGNYESLSDTTKHTFFLFTVKCSVVASEVGEPVGSLVIKEVAARANGRPPSDD